MRKFAWVLHEPLVHFFVIGFILFGWSVANEPDPVSTDEIHVTAGQAENIAMLFERTWKRPPTPAELTKLIDGHIREEVLYREAKNLGLDRDDVIIRRRMVQKYDFLTDDVSALRQPDDDDLAAILQAEKERYGIGAKITFQHIFLSPKNTESDIAKRIEGLLIRLDTGSDPKLLGDPIDLPLRAELADQRRISAAFGPDFADALLEQPIGSWSGPVRSAYGQHLVRVEARSERRLPELVEVRARLEQDWRNAEQKKLRTQLLERLKQNYRIVIDPDVTKAIETAS